MIFKMGLTNWRYAGWLLLGFALIGVAVFGYFFTGRGTTLPPGVLPGWRLAFSDEFDAAQLDDEKWSTCFHFGEIVDGQLRCILGETPAGVFEADNAASRDGLARLTLNREPRTVFGKSFDYTFGMLSSHDAFTFTHGYAEVRAKVPPGRGVWPAFWMLPASKQWPPEIDVFEFLGREPDKIHGTLHMPGFNGQDVARGGFATGEDFSRDFHRYAVRWTEAEIIWYVDDVEYFRVTENVPLEPMYLVVSHGTGAPDSWGGPLSPDVPLPNDLEVDYVRVWTK
jgi:beta-glucanase (GH16 family)